MSAIVKRPFDNAFGAPGEAHSSPFRFGAASTPSHYVTATDIVTDDVDTSTASTATTNTTNNVLSHNNSLLLTPPPMAVAKRSRFHAPAEEGDEGENASAPTTPVAPTLRGNTPFRASGSRRSIEGLENQLPRKLRRKLAAGDTDAVGAELTLTMSEVRELVQCALELQEHRLRTEYDQVLQQQLREQFESFTRFNREHLSRIVNERDFSYCG